MTTYVQGFKDALVVSGITLRPAESVSDGSKAQRAGRGSH
jgi:hypothetical protein